MTAYPPEDGLVSILDRIIDVHLDKAQAHGAFGDLIQGVYKQGKLSRTEEAGRTCRGAIWLRCFLQVPIPSR